MQSSRDEHKHSYRQLHNSYTIEKTIPLKNRWSFMLVSRLLEGVAGCFTDCIVPLTRACLGWARDSARPREPGASHPALSVQQQLQWQCPGQWARVLPPEHARCLPHLWDRHFCLGHRWRGGTTDYWDVTKLTDHFSPYNSNTSK